MTKNLIILTALVVLLVVVVMAQNPQQAGPTAVQMTNGIYNLIPISNTAAVNNQVTLTIPAPPSGQYNYICTLEFNASQDGTATANTNLAITTTNFNSWTDKYSMPATALLTFDKVYPWGSPSTGCVKSIASGTATTFVSPGATLHTAFTLQAGYFQAP